MKKTEKEKAYSRKYYKEHKNELLEKKRIKWAETPKEVHQERQRRWRKKHPCNRLLHQARSSSKLRGLECSISLEDIVIPERCPYLGCILTNKVEKRMWTSVSIDRIDNTKGYVKGNIQVISFLANCMKSNATNEQLLAFANGILKMHKLEIK